MEEIAPRIRAAARSLPQVGADDPEELYQDGLAIAAQMLVSAGRRGKAVTAPSIAWYATRHLLCGRRSTSAGRMDVMSPAAQLDGHSRLTSMDAEVDFPETGEATSLGDLLAWDSDDPSAAAARNLDWEEFLADGDALSRRLVATLARGDGLRALRSETGLSDSGLSGRKRQLGERLLAHFGASSLAGCLAEATRPPQWMADVMAHRAREVRGDDWC